MNNKCCQLNYINQGSLVDVVPEIEAENQSRERNKANSYQCVFQGLQTHNKNGVNLKKQVLLLDIVLRAGIFGSPGNYRDDRLQCAAMSDGLEAAMQQLKIKMDAIDSDGDLDAWAKDDAVEKPRSRRIQSAEELKAELEREFLIPSPRFNTHWLNKLQR